MFQMEYNIHLVCLECQADGFACFAAHLTDRARKIILEGDIAKSLNAADMIGDDRLQQQNRGYVSPSSSP